MVDSADDVGEVMKCLWAFRVDQVAGTHVSNACVSQGFQERKLSVDVGSWPGCGEIPW